MHEWHVLPGMMTYDEFVALVNQSEARTLQVYQCLTWQPVVQNYNNETSTPISPDTIKALLENNIIYIHPADQGTAIKRWIPVGD